MADNDAINEFASEDDAGREPIDDFAADLPLNPSPEAYDSAAWTVDADVEPDAEELYFYDSNSAPAEAVDTVAENAGAVAEDAGTVTEDAGTAVSEDYSYADDHSAYADAYAGLDSQPAPFETSGRIQVVAALATIGMLGVMYVVFVQQRSAALLSLPAAPSQAAATAEPPEVGSAVPPAIDDAVPEAPRVYVPPPFDDPFGLTRGLSPALPPPENFDVRAAAPAATPDSPVPAAATAAASAPEPAASPSSVPASAANVAPTPAAPPPPVPIAQPAAGAPAAASPSTATASTASTASSAPAAPPPAVAASIAPRSAPPVAAAAPPAAVAAIDPNTSSIQNTLARYRKAFSALNASAVREVWPTVNERTLSRAFDRLEQQDVSFDRCQIEVANDRAEATCNGTARYVPRVGSRTPRVDSREWRFNLVKVKDQWLIGALDAR